MSRILFLGASHEHVEAIHKAQEAGFEILAMEQDPQAAACFEADEFFPVDIHDHNTVLEIARASGVEGVLPLSDASLSTAAFVAEHLKLPGIGSAARQNAQSIQDKRRAWQQHGRPYLDCADAERWHRLMGRGRGAAVESLTQNGQTTVLAVSAMDRVQNADRYLNKKNHWPADFDKKIMDRIVDCVAEGFSALSLENGPGHTELHIVDDEIYLLNQYLRPGKGPVFTTLIDRLTGINYVASSCKLAAGHALNITPERCGYFCCIYVFPHDGILDQANGVKDTQKMEGIINVHFAEQNDDSRFEAKNGSNHIGYLLAQGHSAEEAEKRAESTVQALAARAKQYHP